MRFPLLVKCGLYSTQYCVVDSNDVLVEPDQVAATANELAAENDRLRAENERLRRAARDLVAIIDGDGGHQQGDDVCNDLQRAAEVVAAGHGQRVELRDEVERLRELCVAARDAMYRWRDGCGSWLDDEAEAAHEALDVCLREQQGEEAGK